MCLNYSLFQNMFMALTFYVTSAGCSGTSCVPELFPFPQHVPGFDLKQYQLITLVPCMSLSYPCSRTCSWLWPSTISADYPCTCYVPEIFLFQNMFLALSFNNISWLPLYLLCSWSIPCSRTCSLPWPLTTSAGCSGTIWFSSRHELQVSRITMFFFRYSLQWRRKEIFWKDDDEVQSSKNITICTN